MVVEHLMEEVGMEGLNHTTIKASKGLGVTHPGQGMNILNKF